jgi:hypothetical protein
MPSEAIIVRRLARELSLRRRFERLTVRDQERSEKIEKVMMVLAFKLGSNDGDDDDEERERMLTSLRCLWQRWLITEPSFHLIHLSFV